VNATHERGEFGEQIHHSRGTATLCARARARTMAFSTRLATFTVVVVRVAVVFKRRHGEGGGSSRFAELVDPSRKAMVLDPVLAQDDIGKTSLQVFVEPPLCTLVQAICLSMSSV
jgi:hypothetical protein